MADTDAQARLRVGFVGIGSQGGPIAERIALAGFPLTVWARRPEALAPLRDLGAGIAANVSDLGACDIVGLCVLDDAAVAQVFDALLPSLKPGAAVMILATIHPYSCRALAARAAERGVALIDAPVSGGGEVARAGNLTVMVGGEADALARCRPVIDSFAGLVVHLGPIGSGQLAKLVNNSLLAAHMTLGEAALSTGTALGLDRAALATLLAASSGRSYAIDVLGRLPRPAAFAAGAALLRKDVGLLGAVTQAQGDGAARLVETGGAYLDLVEADTSTIS